MYQGLNQDFMNQALTQNVKKVPYEILRPVNVRPFAKGESHSDQHLCLILWSATFVILS